MDREQPSAPFHGRHLHAAFLAWLAERDPALATSLHQPSLPRPFTAARLTLPNRQEIIRYSLLDRRLITVVREGLDSGNGALRLRLASSTHDLVLLDLPAWSSGTTWQALAADAPATQDIRLEFVTPTCFSRDLPGERKRLAFFPLPALLWASWARKWQLFGPPLAELADIAQEAERWLLVANYQLETRALDLGRFRQKGAVGWVDFEMQPGAPAAVAQRLHTLAAFAVYAGSGYKTAMGLGVTRQRT
jgi:CRISPR-associated endoribonuclease Cas6